MPGARERLRVAEERLRSCTERWREALDRAREVEARVVRAEGRAADLEWMLAHPSLSPESLEWIADALDLLDSICATVATKLGVLGPGIRIRQELQEEVRDAARRVRMRLEADAAVAEEDRAYQDDDIAPRLEALLGDEEEARVLRHALTAEALWARDTGDEDNVAVAERLLERAGERRVFSIAPFPRAESRTTDEFCPDCSHAGIWHVTLVGEEGTSRMYEPVPCARDLVPVDGAGGAAPLCGCTAAVDGRWQIVPGGVPG